MIEGKSISQVITLLLTCAAVLLTSCSDVPILSGLSSSKSSSLSASNGNGPPDHAPAWGYRRKHGQTTVVSSESVVVAGTEQATDKKDDNDDDDNDKTKLLVAGAAIAAGTVYAVVNERDKKKTQQQTQEQLDQIKQDMNVVTVNVTNSNGSISQVRLQKQGIGYVGPNGEFYDHLPTEEELKPTCGL